MPEKLREVVQPTRVAQADDAVLVPDRPIFSVAFERVPSGCDRRSVAFLLVSWRCIARRLQRIGDGVVTRHGAAEIALAVCDVRRKKAAHLTDVVEIQGAPRLPPPGS